MQSNFLIKSVIVLLAFLSGCSNAQDDNVDSDTQYELAMNYLYGENGYSQNDKEAVKWFTKSADQGESSAQNNLAIMHLNGRGTKQSTELAKKYFLMAANQNHVNGQIQTALILLNEGDKRDAEKWLRLAVKNEDTYAYYYLGKYLIADDDNSKSHQEGVEMLIKSADANYSTAMMELYNYYDLRGDQTNAIFWLKKAAALNEMEAVKKLQK